jgi:hypothetical protein
MQSGLTINDHQFQLSLLFSANKVTFGKNLGHLNFWKMIKSTVSSFLEGIWNWKFHSKSLAIGFGQGDADGC